jgi:serine O-acetyltransferase
MIRDTIRAAAEYVREDVCTALESDPAATSVAAALLYPGLHAVWLHRIEHALWERGHRLLARTFSQLTRLLTGVEIHPAATIGRRVFVDHGMGVVIGETAQIGDDVHMYHGVTLGGDDPQRVKRHPTVHEGATLGANATLIGDIEVGRGATVGAGAVVLDDVSPGTTVVGNPAEPIDREEGEEPPAGEPATETARGNEAAGGGEDERVTAATDSAGSTGGWLSC